MADQSAAPQTGGEPEERITLSSQPNPASVSGPDTTKLPPNPLSGQPQPSGSYEEPDWERRYKGLDRKYQQDRQEWEKQTQEKDDAMSDLTQQFMARLEALEARLPAPEPKPEPQAAKAAGSQEDSGNEGTLDGNDFMWQRVKELEAERFKTMAVMKAMQQGQPGHGLPLLEWLDEIPIRLGEDGMPDAKEQERAVLKVVEKIKGLRGEASKATQQAMTAGYTPGSAPGTPPKPASAEAEIAEYHELMDLRMSPGYLDLPQVEQNKADKRFYDLLDKYGPQLPGVHLPWMSMDQLLGQVRQSQADVNELKAMLANK